MNDRLKLKDICLAEDYLGSEEGISYYEEADRENKFRLEDWQLFFLFFLFFLLAGF